MQAGATETNDADEPEEESLFFVEADEVLGLITSFSDPEKTAAAHAAAAERVAHVLDRYQEQPTVLDPQLEAMVVPLLEAVRAVARDGASRELLPHTCRVMYTLCKVRGYKTIVRFVPHEVADLEPLVALLMSLDPTDYASWQVAYSLMVWLCMVVMVPFDLAIIDSGQVAAAAANPNANPHPSPHPPLPQPTSTPTRTVTLTRSPPPTAPTRTQPHRSRSSARSSRSRA